MLLGRRQLAGQGARRRTLGAEKDGGILVHPQRALLGVDAESYVAAFANAGERRKFESAWHEFIRDVMTCDIGGCYYPFALAYGTRLSRPLVFRILQRAAFATTVAMHPELPRTKTWRHPPAKSCGVVVLPAVSAYGAHHTHGLLRLPFGDTSSDCNVAFPVQQDAVSIVVEGPRALQKFVEEFRSKAHSACGRRCSFWLANASAADRLRPVAANNTSHQKLVMDHLAYLKHSDAGGELRLWTEAALMPRALFKKIRATTVSALD